MERYSNGDIKETWYFPPPFEAKRPTAQPDTTPTIPTSLARPAYPNSNRSVQFVANNSPPNLNLGNLGNRSIYMTNLPAYCTYEALFKGIYRVGAIAHAIIHPPKHQNATAGAELEFFDSASVDRIFAHLRAGNLRIGYRTPFVHVSHSSAPPLPQFGVTRVVQVAGPTHLVSAAYLGALFSAMGLVYDLEIVRTMWEYIDVRCIEFRFASYRTQAVYAVEILEEQKRKMGGDWEKVVVQYGPDPCCA